MTETGITKLNSTKLFHSGIYDTGVITFFWDLVEKETTANLYYKARRHGEFDEKLYHRPDPEHSANAD